MWAGSYANTCDLSINEKGHNFVLNQVVGLGKLKIPQSHEILVTLSAQINIFTLNTATSTKKGGRDQFDPEDYYGNIGGTAAMAGVMVGLLAVDSDGDETTCEPGEVIMASRFVEVRLLAHRHLLVITP